MSWDSNTATAFFSDYIQLAVWSPCNQFIAISSWDYPLVGILDSATLVELQTFRFKPEGNYTRTALRFSPDSRLLTCSFTFGYKWSLATRDLQTGRTISTIESPLNKHSSSITDFTYSRDGETIGVLHWKVLADKTTTATAISIYKVFSGIHTHDVHYSQNIPAASPTELSFDNEWFYIWTHGESLRFTTATLTTATIWEVGFVPGTTPTEVGSFSIPDSYKPPKPSSPRFNPTLNLLLFIHPLCGIFIWDVQQSKSLLHCTDIKLNSKTTLSSDGRKSLLHFKDIKLHLKTTFSSDGRFFACPTLESEIYLWKRSSAGYALHAMLTPSTRSSVPLLSPNGEMLFTFNNFLAYNDTVTRLWHTKDFTTPISSLIQAHRTENFVLDFLPGGSLTVFARQKDDTVTVLDLNSGVPQWTIDAGMEVYGLRAFGKTIAVIGQEKLIAWDLPGGAVLPGARMGVEESVRTITLNPIEPRWPVIAASASLDFGYVALVYDGAHVMDVYNTIRQDRLRYSVSSGALWFLPQGNDIGFVSYGKGEAQIINFLNDQEDRIPIGDIEYGQWGCPYGSSSGYRITDDGWIITPSRKRLLMLPPHWHPEMIRRVWNGKFLALLHGALPEAVILELELPAVPFSLPSGFAYIH